MKLNTLVLAIVVAMSVTACGSSPKTIGEISAKKSEQYDQVADNYRKGNKLIAKGNKQIKAGKKDVKKGYKLIDKGQDNVDEGNKLNRKAKALYEKLGAPGDSK